MSYHSWLGLLEHTHGHCVSKKPAYHVLGDPGLFGNVREGHLTPGRYGARDAESCDGLQAGRVVMLNLISMYESVMEIREGKAFVLLRGL